MSCRQRQLSQILRQLPTTLRYDGEPSSPNLKVPPSAHWRYACLSSLHRAQTVAPSDDDSAIPSRFRGAHPAEQFRSADRRLFDSRPLSYSFPVVPAHCATERRPQGTIRQRRIFGIGDASPDADDAWAAHLALKPAEEAPSSRSQSAAVVPDVNAPSRTVRPPFGLFDPFSAGLGQFQPTAFKTPVRTSVATEFNSGEHTYNTIKPRSPSIPKMRQIGRETSKGSDPTCFQKRGESDARHPRGLSPHVLSELAEKPEFQGACPHMFSHMFLATKNRRNRRCPLDHLCRRQLRKHMTRRVLGSAESCEALFASRRS